MITLWGFKTCSSVQKACKWLNEHDIPFFFIDTKIEPPNIERLTTWAETVGIEKLINKKSLGWRSLSEEEKKSLDTTYAYCKLMLNVPRLIKRPIITSHNNKNHILTIGFNNQLYEHLIDKGTLR